MKKFFSYIAIALTAVLVGCAEAEPGRTFLSASAKKPRKIALHGYVYSDISLADTVKKAAEMKVDGVVMTKRQFIGGENIPK